MKPLVLSASGIYDQATDDRISHTLSTNYSIATAGNAGPIVPAASATNPLSNTQ